MIDTTQVLRIFPLEQQEGDPDPTRCGAHLPIGAEVFSVYQHRDGIRLAVMGPKEVGVRVWHPMVIAVADQPVTPNIGRAFGKPLAMMPIAGTPAALLPELPWPTHAEAAN